MQYRAFATDYDGTLAKDGHVEDIIEQLGEFEDSLCDNSPQYVKLTMGQVRRTIEGCGFKTLADLDAEAVQKCFRWNDGR